MADIRPLEFGEIDAWLQEMLQPTVDRLGYFGAFFQYASHAPDVLSGFMRFSGALKTALPDDVNEAIALTVCTAMNFPYERIQHERLSEKLGFDRDWIALLAGREGSSATAELTLLQQSARDLSLALVSGRYQEAREAADSIARSGTEPMAVAALFQATRFMQVCTVGRVLDMEIGVLSIFAAD